MVAQRDSERADGDLLALLPQDVRAQPDLNSSPAPFKLDVAASCARTRPPL